MATRNANARTWAIMKRSFAYGLCFAFAACSPEFHVSQRPARVEPPQILDLQGACRRDQSCVRSPAGSKSDSMPDDASRA